MRILAEEKNTIIEDVSDFDIEQTLECGQCFHFEKIDEKEYGAAAKGHMLHIEQDGRTLIFYDTDIDTVKNIWIPYFDLERDYGAIKRFLLNKDEKLADAIEKEGGIRILNQEFHETLISFIISQNKQIPQIKQLVKRISERYGTYLGEINGVKYYSFPDEAALGKISEQDYRDMKTGFRAPYLKDASERLSSGRIYAEMFDGMAEENVRAALTGIRGVGEKVANCVMLYSLGFRNAFPIDVWIKRIMENIYFKEDTDKAVIQKFAAERFGEYGGYAQQYMFAYYRKHSSL